MLVLILIGMFLLADVLIFAILAGLIIFMDYLDAKRP